MADDKTTKTPEQPVTDSGPGKETPPAPPKEPEKVSVSPEPEKKTEPCLLYTSPSPRDLSTSRMPSSA